MTRLSHKCRKLRDLVLPLFQVLELSTLNSFIHSMLVFHVITPTILYIPDSKNIEGPRERERERERESMPRRL